MSMKLDNREGLVSEFDDQLGCGKVIDNETKNTYFFHYLHIKTEGFKTLQRNDQVFFSLTQNTSPIWPFGGVRAQFLVKEISKKVAGWKV